MYLNNPKHNSKFVFSDSAPQSTNVPLTTFLSLKKKTNQSFNLLTSSLIEEVNNKFIVNDLQAKPPEVESTLQHSIKCCQCFVDDKQRLQGNGRVRRVMRQHFLVFTSFFHWVFPLWSERRFPSTTDTYTAENNETRSFSLVDGPKGSAIWQSIKS